MRISLRKLLPAVLLCAFCTSVKAQVFNQPQWSIVFKAATMYSSPIGKSGKVPQEYYTAWYRIPAMGVRSERQEITIAPVFVYLPRVYTMGNRGILLSYQYDITAPYKANVIFAGANAFSGNISFEYYRFVSSYEMDFSTFEGGIFAGLRHNFNEHLNIQASGGIGTRSLKVSGIPRPAIGQINLGLSYVL
jgi:hypothetical protein